MTGTLELLDAFETKIADGFPLGQEGAAVLDSVKRIEELIAELKSYYRAKLAQDAACVPGWTLKPGATRRSLSDPQACWEKVSDVLSSKVFMSAVKVEIGKLQDIWASAARVPSTQAKEAFNKLMGELIVTFQNAPSLIKVN
jgi:hypothetical protein